MLFQVLFTCTLLFHIPDIYGTFYNPYTATVKFNEFKRRYNKQYMNSFDENEHFYTFVNNLNAAAELNETSQVNDTIYVLNKYADLDPKRVEKTYAIQLKTYDVVKKGDHEEVLRSDHGVEINDQNLFNLKKSDELFERYIADEHRQLKDKRDGFIHFYRFVKTLAQKNRDIYEGKDAPALGHAADILIASKEYFY